MVMVVFRIRVSWITRKFKSFKQFLVLKQAHVLALASFFSGHGLASYVAFIDCIKTIIYNSFYDVIPIS